MKIAVIGAGIAGLTSLRYIVEAGYECVVLEQSGKIGGNWNYSDHIGPDEYGLPVHSSIYEGLRTNIPKELMQFEDFPYVGTKLSYISQAEILQYILDYAKHFNLEKYIKFHQHVVEVDPLPGEKWAVTVKDMKTKTTERTVYDSIVICVGNYSIPKLPTIPGVEKFKGDITHCHFYRRAEPYRNKRVLVVGASFSGTDISKLIVEVADKVILVNRGKDVPDVPKEVIVKPEIVKFGDNNTVYFKDNTEEVVDKVLWCTGYNYTYPFLTPNCKIEIEDNWVKYLYKHIVNIEHPTMALMGVPFRWCPFPVLCVQARFYLELLSGRLKVTKQQMLDEVNELVLKRKRLGQPTHWMHRLAMEQGAYMDDLADTAEIKRAPSVLQKIYENHHQHGRTFNICYEIINDNEFKRYEIGEE